MMSRSKRSEDQGTSVIGLALARKANVFALLNSFEKPIDAEEVGSTIHAVTIVDEELTGEPIQYADGWFTAVSSPGGVCLYAVSMEGTVQLFDGKQWSVVTSEATDGLNVGLRAAPSATRHSPWTAREHHRSATLRTPDRARRDGSSEEDSARDRR